jgi:hypothetical protein
MYYRWGTHLQYATSHRPTFICVIQIFYTIEKRQATHVFYEKLTSKLCKKYDYDFLNHFYTFSVEKVELVKLKLQS